MKRTLLWLSLALVAVGLAAVIGLAAKVHALGDRLVADTRALAARDVKRPALWAPAVNSSFAQLSKPLMEEANRLSPLPWNEQQKQPEDCAAVRNVERPWSALPEGCRVLFERDRDWALRVLEAARAESAGTLPLDMKGASLLYAGRTAALDGARLMAEGRPDEALDRCLGVQALARDVGLSGSLITAMMGLAIHGLVHGECLAAADAATPEAKRLALQRLELIRTSLQTQVGWLPAESVETQLLLFGDLLTLTQQDQLPADARAFILEGDHLRGLLMLRALSWPGLRTALDRREAVVALNAQARLAALDTLDDELSTSWNPYLRGTPRLSRFVRRLDRRDARLALLAAALQADLTHLETGHWPAPTALVDGVELPDGGWRLTAVDPDPPDAGMRLEATLHSD